MLFPRTLTQAVTDFSAITARPWLAATVLVVGVLVVLAIALRHKLGRITYALGGLSLSALPSGHV